MSCYVLSPQVFPAMLLAHHAEKENHMSGSSQIEEIAIK
jgi:hypothetical protein